MYSLIFLGALAGSALAQSTIGFSNTTFVNGVVVDAVWPISYTAGNGEPVALVFGNETYSFQVVGKLPTKPISSTQASHTNTIPDGLAAPGTYNWDVKVPVNVVDGLYQLALMQGDDTIFSPAFQLTGTQGAPTTDAPTTDVTFPTVATATETTTATQTVTAIYLPGPDGQLHAAGNTTGGGDVYVTYIFYDDDCACHHTSSCPAAEMPASTAMSSTTVTYSQAECGCTTTVEAPCAETVIPVVPAAPAPAPTSAPPAAPAAATNAPVAPPSAAPAAPAPVEATTMAATPTLAAQPSAFTGGAGTLAGSSFGLAALLALLA